MWGLPLSTSFSLPGITNRAEGTLPRNASSFKQLGAFRSSHVQENQDKTLSLPVWHCTACAVISTLQPLSTMFIAPQQALLPHTPHPGQSLLKFVGAWQERKVNNQIPGGVCICWEVATAWGLLQARWRSLVPEGLVPTGGCHEHPTYVPVPPRMSLKLEGMLYEARGGSCAFTNPAFHKIQELSPAVTEQLSMSLASPSILGRQWYAWNRT